MPTPVVEIERWRLLLILALLLAGLASLGIDVTQRPAHAQTTGVIVTQFPGASVEFLGRPGETHTMVTFCPAGMFAISGGWSGQGASYAVTESYPSQLPGGGLPGAWTLTARKLGKGPLTLTPDVSCLGGAAQVPE